MQEQTEAVIGQPLPASHTIAHIIIIIITTTIIIIAILINNNNIAIIINNNNHNNNNNNNNKVKLSIAHMLYIIQHNKQLCCVMSQLDSQTGSHDTNCY